MLITKWFTFLHVPKTGGDFIRRLCERRLPEGSIISTEGIAKHGPDVEIPEQYRDLPRFALVRNPWDWHVSWYHYLMGAGRPPEHRERVRKMNPWFPKLSLDFEADFATTLRRLYDPAVAETMSPGSIVRLVHEDGADLLTMHLRWQISQSLTEDSVTVGRFENLRGDFHDFLNDAHVPLSDRFRLELFQKPPVNTSKRGGYRTYYTDDDLIDRIAELGSETIERYGYTFGDPGAADA